MEKIIKRDYTTFSGPILEKYFIQKMKQEGNYSNIGIYWEKGNQNEIDIVAINELDKSIVYGEVKRKKKNISLVALEKKTEKLHSKFSDYQANYIGLSIEDM